MKKNVSWATYINLLPLIKNAMSYLGKESLKLSFFTRLDF